MLDCRARRRNPSRRKTGTYKIGRRRWPHERVLQQERCGLRRAPRPDPDGRRWRPGRGSTQYEARRGAGHEHHTAARGHPPAQQRGPRSSRQPPRRPRRRHERDRGPRAVRGAAAARSRRRRRSPRAADAGRHRRDARHRRPAAACHPGRGARRPSPPTARSTGRSTSPRTTTPWSGCSTTSGTSPTATAARAGAATRRRTPHPRPPEHHELLELIVAGDADGAGALMRAHVDRSLTAAAITALEKREDHPGNTGRHP